jgi:DNA polymerase (family 10)
MVNQQIAEIFNNMAAYCEMSTDRNAFFRGRAFKKAAEIVDKFPYDFADPEWSGDIDRMKKLEGIGPKTAEHIKEYVETGKIQDYENMKAESPVKLEELLKVQSVGPKTILKLYKELGVTDLVTLKAAAESGKIAELEGFGKKKEQNILESISFAIRNKDRVSISVAEDQVKELLKFLDQDRNITKIEFGGSFRRRKETIGDIDVLILSKDPKFSMENFCNYSQVDKILGHGDTKCSVWLKSKIQVDMRALPKESFGAALQYFTGSKEHNVKLRNISIAQGYKLSDYGLFKRLKNDEEGEMVEGDDEVKIYKRLGLQFVPPELRENLGEIEAEQKGELPELITLKNIKGDLQMHTVNSDGSNTVEEMALKCKELGYEYLGITDHFGKLKIAGAIDPKEFDGYLKSIRDADEKVKGIKIYASGEIEIGKEGELEFPEEMLKQLDYVIASVHFSTKMDKKEMTQRIITALKNPLTKILAHPTGRIIGQRPGFEFDYREVFKVAKEEGVALEINAHPSRLDLNDNLTKLAVDLGCKIVINTDSHAAVELTNMKYGIDVARRGWVQEKDLAKIDHIARI